MIKIFKIECFDCIKKENKWKIKLSSQPLQFKDSLKVL